MPAARWPTRRPATPSPTATTRLATALGVQNGATYWHFPSKQALLAAMAESLLGGLTDGSPDGAPWRQRLAELAGRLRRALTSRRDGARLFAGVFFPLPNALAYGDTMIGILRGAGLSARDAVWAVDTLTYYVVGHVTEEQLAATGGGDTAPLESAVDPARHPHLHAALEYVPAPHPEEHFEYGLALILDGLAGRAR
jgi:TetR/AcrR family tetracycline transcriptional repressor